jgi:hypothetical protein
MVPSASDTAVAMVVVKALFFTLHIPVSCSMGVEGDCAALGSPAIPLAANYSDVRYGGGTLIRRYSCHDGYHLYGDEIVVDCEEERADDAPVPVVCALDATRHEGSEVKISTGTFPEKAIDAEDSGIHKGQLLGRGGYVDLTASFCLYKPVFASLAGG